SNYFTAHLVGRSIHKTFPKLRWVADLGDPFSFGIVQPNNRLLYSTLNHFIERSIFRQADAMSVTTKGVLEEYEAKYPENASKFSLIPALIYIKDTPPAKKISHSQNNKIMLVYAGRFYANMRRPEHLLKLFSTLVEGYPQVDFELHVFGYSRD